MTITTGIDIMRETARRTWTKTLRRPVPLTFSFVQPLFWMLIFGFLFHRFTLGPAYAGFTYLDFVLPGICAMTALFGASQSGIAIVRDMQNGFLQRMVRSSAGPGWLLAGMVGADVTRLLAQALVVGLLGIALGARPTPSAAGVAVAAAGLAAFAAAYAGLSCWIALKSGAQESMAAFVHVVNMPLLFTSTALVPSRQMPEWLEVAARWNPLSLVTDAMREALLFGRVPHVEYLLPLPALALIACALATRAMARAAET